MYLSLSVLVAVEIVTEVPFASRFSAAAGATELLRGWKELKRLHSLRSLILQSGELAAEDMLVYGALAL
jgi:hypothetical protein